MLVLAPLFQGVVYVYLPQMVLVLVEVQFYLAGGEPQVDGEPTAGVLAPWKVDDLVVCFENQVLGRGDEVYHELRVVAELELKREMTDLGEKGGYMEDEDSAGSQGWHEAARG